MKKPKDLLTTTHPKTAQFHNPKVPQEDPIITRAPLEEPAEEIPTKIGAKIGFLLPPPPQDRELRLNAIKVPEKEEVTIHVNKPVEEVSNVQVAL